MLPIFAVIFLISMSAGAVIQNLQLKERIVMLEPRITKVERTRVRSTRIDRTRTINRTPVIKRETINRPVRGLPGSDGSMGNRGARGPGGRRGSQGPQGKQGPRGPVGKVLNQDDGGLQDTVDKLQSDVLALRTQLNQLLCLLLRKCPAVNVTSTPTPPPGLDKKP